MSKIHALQVVAQSSQDALRTRSVGIDWLTCTATATGDQSALWDYGMHILGENERVGESSQSWQMKGYRGRCVPHCRVGSRADGVILSVSGIQCAKYWRDALMASENCSRLDLAVDVDSDPVTPSLARDIYSQVTHNPPRQGRPLSSRLIQGSDGGSTVYIGSRVSERFARVYDKGIEQQTAPAGQWWRWEVEFKGKSAKMCAAALLAAPPDSDKAGSIIGSYFRSTIGWCPPLNSAPAVCHWGPEPTTDDQRLLWLSRGVRPTVQRLVDRFGAPRVLFALGFLQSAFDDPSLPVC